MKLKKNLTKCALILLLAGQITTPLNAYASEQNQQELYEIIQETNQKNRNLDAPKNSMDQFRYNFKNNKSKLTQNDTSIMWKDYNRKNIKKNFPAIKARKETKWLFRLLRSQYGLYTYYGGDAKFIKAKKAVLKEIGIKGNITTKKYQKILHKNLGFITDCHLVLVKNFF